VNKSTALWISLSLPVLASWPASVSAQQIAEPAKLACRDLSTNGGVLLPNETLVNGQACHEANAKPPRPSSAVMPQTKAMPQAEPASYKQPVTATPGAAPAAGPDIASMRINSGSTVFIQPMGGFETYMESAMVKKEVSLMPIIEEAKANYLMKGSSEETEKQGGVLKAATLGQMHSQATATIQLIDRRTSAIVFAYTVTKKNTLHAEQSAAEDVAKHLKDRMDQ
jgi:hypothetical protein